MSRAAGRVGRVTNVFRLHHRGETRLKGAKERERERGGTLKGRASRAHSGWKASKGVAFLESPRENDPSRAPDFRRAFLSRAIKLTRSSFVHTVPFSGDNRRSFRSRGYAMFDELNETARAERNVSSVIDCYLNSGTSRPEEIFTVVPAFEQILGHDFVTRKRG